MSLQSDGKIIVTSYRGVQRLNSDGSFDESFRQPALEPVLIWNTWPIPLDPPVIAQSVSVDPWDDILIAGSFTTINGIPMDGVARLLGGADVKPLKFESLTVSGFNLLLNVAGPTNYFSVLESNQGGSNWTPLLTNLLSSGSSAFQKTGTSAY
jgi:hypothetical protein